jgi:uncharacterized membrane protein
MALPVGRVRFNGMLLTSSTFINSGSDTRIDIICVSLLYLTVLHALSCILYHPRWLLAKRPTPYTLPFTKNCVWLHTHFLDTFGTKVRRTAIVSGFTCTF